MSRRYGVVAVAVSSAEEAVEGADILATCTDSMSPGDRRRRASARDARGQYRPSDLGPDAKARIDCVVRQGAEVLPIPESDSYVRGLGHNRGAFLAGTAEERRSLPRNQHRTPAKREWPT